MQIPGLLFFMIFAVTLAVMYLSVRREWVRPELSAAIGVLVSIIAMVLSLLQSNDDTSLLQALFFGVLIGLFFSGATLAVAWYFHSNELREKMRNQ
jgi:uncharacterized membrane protein